MERKILCVCGCITGKRAYSKMWSPSNAAASGLDFTGKFMSFDVFIFAWPTKIASG